MIEFGNKFGLLTYGLARARPGAAVEFGVGDGTTLKYIAEHRPGQTYGFDSFEGLPEDWRPGFEKGRFACDPPEVPGATLVHGLFENTVPEKLPDDIGFIHIDCDLYSSTKTVLEGLGKLSPGVVIHFDELFGYPLWPIHEFSALLKWIGSSGTKLEVIGYVPSSEQMSFIVRES